MSAASVAAGSSGAAADGAVVLPVPGSQDNSHRPLFAHRQWQCHVLVAVAALHCARWAHNDQDVAAKFVAAADAAAVSGIGVAGGAEVVVVHLEQFAAGAAVSVRF